MINPQIFREYDIRGNADKDFTDENVAKMGRAIGTFLRRQGATQVSLGRDCRMSSNRIHSVLADSLLKSGLNVLDVGLVPTPLLYFSTFTEDVQGGVMITGSHNPPEQNGFKVCSGQSTLFGDEIQSLRKMVEQENFEHGKGRLASTNVRQKYIETVKKSILHPLRIKVVLDSGNGMAGMVAQDLMRSLGCNVEDLFPEPDGRFPNHHPDPTVLENLRDLIQAVQRTKADVGIGFDGDADRIGVVDPTGRVIYGDELLVLYSRQILKSHRGAKIISEVKASGRLFKDIAQHGGVGILWKTGHSLIKAKMKDENALLAGEMSGHMFFRDRYFGFDDAIYAAARLLEILSQEKRSPAELLSDLPLAVTTPEIRVECPEEIKFKVVERVKQEFIKKNMEVIAIDGVRVEYPDGWGLVRASNTQPVLVLRFEGQTEKRLREIQSTFESEVSRQLEALCGR